MTHFDIKQLAAIGMAIGMAAAAAPATAATVFSEDFSGATPGFGYTGTVPGTKFTASRDVDIVGVKNGSFFDCGALNPGGNCLDLVGGTGAGGTITSTSFALWRVRFTRLTSPMQAW